MVISIMMRSFWLQCLLFMAIKLYNSIINKIRISTCLCKFQTISIFQKHVDCLFLIQALCFISAKLLLLDALQLLISYPLWNFVSHVSILLSAKGYGLFLSPNKLSILTLEYMSSQVYMILGEYSPQIADSGTRESYS